MYMNYKQVIRYCHETAGFPTKATWLKVTKARFFASWPMLTATAIAKHFPESPKTQKGHMQHIFHAPQK